MKLPSIVPLLAIALLAGCTGTGYRKPDAAPETPGYVEVEREMLPCGANEDAFDCDRRAILAMQGEFKVSFRFDETAVLAPGYARKPEQRSGGFETVVLVEDTGKRIDLQHILVVGDGMVVKHWRQTWIYEADAIWAFDGEQRYIRKARDPATVAGTWTQFVHEVSDAPRYTGSGRWNHRYGVSTWTSDRSWRPLPRRE